MTFEAQLSPPACLRPLPQVYCAHTNPSPVFLPNGSVVMAFNAGFCHDTLETIGVAHAPHWSGPYSLLAKEAVLRNPDVRAQRRTSCLHPGTPRFEPHALPWSPSRRCKFRTHPAQLPYIPHLGPPSGAHIRFDPTQGTPHRCEDPHLWISSRGWHLLTHNQQGPQGVSSYGFSLDGVAWHLAPATPYNCTITYTDGGTAEASGCGNRPQLVWSQTVAEGGRPLWLVNGAMSANPSGGHGTWTLFRQLKSAS
jgi:hypothetical protein